MVFIHGSWIVLADLYIFATIARNQRKHLINKMIAIESVEQLSHYTKAFPARYAFVGHAGRKQFRDFDATIKRVAALLDELDATYGGPDRWLAIFDGDPLHEDKVDIAHAMRCISGRGTPVLSVQADCVKKPLRFVTACAD